MFEKKAEEIAKDIYIHHFDDDVIYPNVLKAITAGVQKGAEFGYNKANEWHYVKDGDLPKKTDKYLVYIINGYGSKFIDLIQYNSGRHFWCVACQNDVIAWKEIVLPKEEQNGI